MQPFDKHQADPAALEGCGASLVNEGATALQNGKITREAYEPAIPAVTGVCAPAVSSARKPTQDSADGAYGQLVWAAVVTQYWGGRVKGFNARVDEITGDLARQGPEYGAEGTGGEEPTDAQVREAKQAATAEAKRQWWQAHENYVQQGRTRTASMLREGPTAANMSIARDAGVLPPMELGPWDRVVDSFKGLVVPPGDQGGLGVGGWGGGTVLSAAGWLRDYWTARNVQFKPRGPNGQFVRVDAWRASNGWWQRYQGYTNPKYAVPKPYQAASAARWAKFGRVAGPVGAAVNGVTGALDQWSRDEGRTDLSTDERYVRAGYRGALNAAGGLAGAAMGAKAGAMLGSFGGPVGVAIGGVAGALIGGAIGSGAAGAVADYTVEKATELYEGAKDFASDAVDKGKELLDDITPW